MSEKPKTKEEETPKSSNIILYVMIAIVVVLVILVIVLAILLIIKWTQPIPTDNTYNNLILSSPGLPCNYSSFVDLTGQCYSGSVCYRKQVNYTITNNSSYNLVLYFSSLYTSTGCTGGAIRTFGNNITIPAINTGNNVSSAVYLSNVPNSVPLMISYTKENSGTTGFFSNYNINGKNSTTLSLPINVNGIAKIVISDGSPNPTASVTYQTT